jgi:hypothetical protein
MDYVFFLNKKKKKKKIKENKKDTKKLRELELNWIVF